MTEILFIEGISGVGKSTTAKRLADELRFRSFSVEEYIEFDYKNPIDFYCTAYIPCSDYERLCTEYKLELESIKENTIDAGKAKLIRYYDGDTPLFGEPLLSQLSEREFCWNPKKEIPFEDYTDAYVEVWRGFAEKVSSDFVIFDGSLLHHPINDMMRNYGISEENALNHVKALLEALGSLMRKIFYLKTDDIAKQLTLALLDRGQPPPNESDIRFWSERYRKDMYVLQRLDEDKAVFSIPDGWDAIIERVLERI